MAITFVGKGAIGEAASGNVSPGIPAGVLANDILICISSSNDNATHTISDTGWNKLTQQDAGGGETAAIFWKRAVGSDSAPTVAKSAAGQVTVASIYAFRGCITTGSPIDANWTINATTSASATVSTTAMTPGQDNCMIVFTIHYNDNPTSFSDPTDYDPGGIAATDLGNDQAVDLKYKLQTTAALENPSSTRTGGANRVNNGGLLALIPASSATTNSFTKDGFAHVKGTIPKTSTGHAWVKYSATTIAQDTFTRTTSDSFGAAEIGGSWEVSNGTDANFDTSGNTGTIVAPTGGTQQIGHLSGLSVQNAEVYLEVAPQSATGTNNQQCAITWRQSGGASHNRTTLVFNAGSITSSTIHSTGTVLIASHTIQASAANAGEWWCLRIQFSSEQDSLTSTTIRTKAWKRGTAEPASWNGEATGVTGGNQTAGSIGIRVANTDSSNRTLEFDNLIVTPIQQSATNTGYARVALGVTTQQQTKDSHAWVKVGRTSSSSAYAWIKAASLVTSTGNAWVKLTGLSRTNNAWAYVLTRFTQTKDAHSWVKVGQSQNQSAHAWVKLLQTQTDDGFAHVKTSLSTAQNAWAHVKALNFSASSNGYAWIKVINQADTKSAHAWVKVQQQLSSTGYAHVLASFSTQQSAHAWVRSNQSLSSTAYAWVRANLSVTNDAHAWIKSNLSASSDGHAWVKTAFSDTKQGYAWVQTNQSLTGGDSWAYVVPNITGGQVTKSAWAHVLATQTETEQAFAHVLANLSDVNDGYAWVKSQITYTEQAWAHIKASLSVTRQGYAWVKTLGQEYTQEAHAFVSDSITYSRQAFAHVKGNLTKTDDAWAHVKATLSNEEQGDAWVKATLSTNQDGHAWVVATLQDSNTAHAWVTRHTSDSDTGYAWVKAVQSVSATGSAYVTQIVGSFLNKDAHAWVQAANQTTTQTGYAWVQQVQTSTDTGNAWVKAALSVTSDSYAHVRSTFADEASGHAWCIASFVVTFTGNAWVRQQTSQTQDARAYVTSLLGQSYQGYAYVKSVSSTTEDGYAWVKVTGTGTQQGGAVVVDRHTQTQNAHAWVKSSGYLADRVGWASVKDVITRTVSGFAYIEKAPSVVTNSGYVNVKGTVSGTVQAFAYISDFKVVEITGQTFHTPIRTSVDLITNLRTGVYPNNPIQTDVEIAVNIRKHLTLSTPICKVKTVKTGLK